MDEVAKFGKRQDEHSGIRKPIPTLKSILLLSVPLILAIAVVAGVWQVSGFQLGGTPSKSTEPLQGRASVIDGDTIEIHGQRIRLNGIDAPESDQICYDANRRRYRCGLDAIKFLYQFLEKSLPTRCDFVEWDQYDLFVGDCYRADGESVAAGLVRAGHALDWYKYSRGAYASLQEEARAEKIGMWVGGFERPWDYRAKQPSNAESENQSLMANPASSSCRIKGDISPGTGERIYHLPRQKSYNSTVISASKGERWFCSEAEARAAGWRRARR